MKIKQAQAALLALTILFSASVCHAQWQWMASLKAFFSPLASTVQEYPKLTVAFTVLSCLCIANAQEVQKQYQAYKKVQKTLQEKKAYFAQQNLAQKNNYRRVTNQLLANESQAWQKCLPELDREITREQRQLAPNQTPDNNAQEFSQAAKQSRDTFFKIKQKTLERDSLNAQIQQERKKLSNLICSPAFIAQAKEKMALARKIKNRPSISIDSVLKEARELLVPAKASAQLRKKILEIREQLASIQERKEKTYDQAKQKYINQLKNIQPTIAPEAIYRLRGLTPAQGVVRSPAEIEKLIKNDQELEYIFCGAKGLSINPIAKENYDAFLLGSKEFEALIKPTEEQYALAVELNNKLRALLLKVNDALKEERNGTKK